jgi:hypothetical protein
VGRSQYSPAGPARCPPFAGEPPGVAAEVVQVPAESVELELLGRCVVAGEGGVAANGSGQPEVACWRSPLHSVLDEQDRTKCGDHGVVGLRLAVGDDPGPMVATQFGRHRVVACERVTDQCLVPLNQIGEVGGLCSVPRGRRVRPTPRRGSGGQGCPGHQPAPDQRCQKSSHATRRS